MILLLFLFVARTFDLSGDFSLHGQNTDSGEVIYNSESGEQLRFQTKTLSPKEGQVLCRTLGFDKVFEVTHSRRIMEFPYTPLLDIKCNGTEKRIDECEVSVLDITSKHHAAQISCRWCAHCNKISNPVKSLPELKTTERCDILDSIPQLFTDDLVYNHPPPFRPTIVENLRELRQRYEAYVCKHPEVIPVLEKLYETNLGMQSEKILDLPVAEVSQWAHFYQALNFHGVLHSEYDLRIRRQSQKLGSRLSGRARSMWEDLEKNGFTVIEDYGLELEKLRDHANGFLSSEDNTITAKSSGGAVITTRALNPYLEEAFFQTPNDFSASINAYLGGNVRPTGYKTTFLRGNLKNDHYGAGYWHHDRSGRRLKLFIFLNDVDCDHGHPTQIAATTSNMLYFKTEKYWFTRFDEDFVRNTFPTSKLCGKAGSGFIFDTHSIHRGTIEGTNDRTTIIVEYHPNQKCEWTAEHQMQLPCPSGDQREYFGPVAGVPAAGDKKEL